MNKAVKLTPIVKSYIWGGDYFKPYRKGEFDNISESWELSLRDGNNVLAGSTPLNELVKEEDLGPNSKRFLISLY